MTDLLPVNRVQVFSDQECFVPAFNQEMVIDLPRQVDIKRILIIKWGGMGDVVISTAIMEDIRQAFPSAELHLNAMSPWQTLFEDDPRFSDIWCVDLRGSERGLKGYWRWCKQVITHQYDLVIDLQTNDKSRLLLSMLKLVGKAPKYLLGNHPVFPYNIRQTQRLDASHGFHIMRQTMAAGGIPARTVQPKLYPSALHQAKAKALMQTHGLLDIPFAIFLCGSHAAGVTKRWGVTHYVQLARELEQQGLQRVVLVGGKDEIEECEAIAMQCPQLIINFCNQTALLGLPTLFAQAKCIVGNDTGTAHMASATPTPMLVICGPTNPARVKPIGPQVMAIQADLPCKNCYLKQCNHHSCMRGLTVDKVLPFVESIRHE